MLVECLLHKYETWSLIPQSILSTQKVKAGESEAQGHPLLPSEFKHGPRETLPHEKRIKLCIGELPNIYCQQSIKNFLFEMIDQTFTFST